MAWSFDKSSFRVSELFKIAWIWAALVPNTRLSNLWTCNRRQQPNRSPSELRRQDRVRRVEAGVAAAAWVVAHTVRTLKLDKTQPNYAPLAHRQSVEQVAENKKWPDRIQLDDHRVNLA